MGKQLVITEKPSVARDIAAALGGFEDHSDFLESEDLDALAYPSVRRPPARVGEGQGGVACQLSAATGLPAITIPAGLEADALPVGFELLGRPLDDARLVQLAYGYEQAFRPRIPPDLTPPLARADSP